MAYILKSSRSATGADHDRSESFYGSQCRVQLMKKTKFFILKLNQDIQSNIDELKKYTYSLLSILNAVAPNQRFASLSASGMSFCPLGQVRNFSTFCPKHRKVEADAINNVSAPVIPKIDNIVNEITAETPSLRTDTDGSFESNFLHNQIAAITSTYSSYTDASELNIIYPLYQSLKRNDLTLPSIQLYNIVLSSIEKRALDSEFTLEAIENKLTNLLTVYQDILSSGNKPDTETYNLIIRNLLQGNLDCLHLESSNQYQYFATYKRAQEFCQISIELFNSIKAINQLDLDCLVPKLLVVLDSFPELVTKDLLLRLISAISEVNTLTKDTYCTLIGITKHFTKFGIFEGNSKEIYKFIVSVYSDYKQVIENDDNEFAIYNTLIESLVQNGQLALASEFLDEILLDYKNSFALDKKASKSQVSSLISTYIKQIICSGSRTSLFKGYDLLMKFNRISYIPELSISVYNNMINKFINECNSIQIEKQKLTNSNNKSTFENTSKSQELESLQSSIYKNIWKLYDYIAIRKDFQSMPTMESIRADKFNCREVLLSLTLEMGDHTRIFQLIKEIVVKNHLVFDLNVLKKTLNYLYNGVVYNREQGEHFNRYYLGLVWNLVESQAQHYLSNSKDLNDFFSEFVSFLLVPVPQNSPAIPDIIDYNIQMFMNSLTLENAIKDFNFQSDNIYGLIIASKLIMNYSGKDITIINKILLFQAQLVKLFEDSDNHYVELNAELLLFRLELKVSFKSLLERFKDRIVFNQAILEGCKFYDIEVNSPVDPESEIEWTYDLNLSYVLSTNYDVGVSKFIEMFQKGYNFSSGTWEIIFNYNFAVDVLEANFPIKVGDFVMRFMQLNVEHDMKVDLITKLINYNSDKINIKIVQLLLENPSMLLSGTSTDCKVLIYLIKSSEDSPNLYLQALLNDRSFFQLIFSINHDEAWIVEYFKFLKLRGNARELTSIVEDFGIITTGSKLDSAQFKLMYHYLMSLIESDNLAKFNTVFQETFTNQNTSYASDVEFLEMMISYNLAVKSDESLKMIWTDFRKFQYKSQNLKELILLAELILYFRTGEIPKHSNHQVKTIEELAIRLLSSNVGEMDKLYTKNKQLLPNKERKLQLVSCVFDNLIQIQPTVKSDDILRVSFRNVLKFLKLEGFRNVNSEVFVKMIEFLKLIQASDILNIILTKFLHNSKITDILNFYFLEVQLFEDTDKMKVLKSLHSSFKLLGDSFNARVIDDYIHGQTMA